MQHSRTAANSACINRPLTHKFKSWLASMLCKQLKQCRETTSLTNCPTKMSHTVWSACNCSHLSYFAINTVNFYTLCDQIRRNHDKVTALFYYEVQKLNQFNSIIAIKRHFLQQVIRDSQSNLHMTHNMTYTYQIHHPLIWISVPSLITSINCWVNKENCYITTWLSMMTDDISFHGIHRCYFRILLTTRCQPCLQHFDSAH